MHMTTIQGWKISSQACFTCKTISVSASTLCQFRSKTSWHVICPTNNLYLKQTSWIQNTAHMAIPYSFQHHTSASNLNWDVLNDSDFNAWVKYFGMLCSGPDTFTSPYTKPWSSLVISLIDGYLKVPYAKYTWFARLINRDRVAFAWPPNVKGKSTWDCTRNIPSTIQASTFLGASVIILISSLLKRVDLLVDILSPSVWEKSKERM